MASPLALVWDLIVTGNAPEGFLKTAAAADKAAVAAERATKGVETSSARMSAAGAKMSKGITLPLLGIAAVGVDMAAKFQQSTNVLVTAAGESTKNLGMIRKGILDIASSTGTSWKSVTDGMYQLEKAGYRGADALKVERAAAQGAREEGASLGTVTAAMTSIMASYHIKASGAVMVMNEMKTAAGEAKTTMEQFAGSLSTVLPIASANKISFADIAGSLASLTQHGTSADEAAQELAFTMRGLSAPNMVAQKEMSQLGISSVDVAQKLGDGPGGRGLAGTLNYLSETVLHRMGPSGLVLLNTFNQSRQAAADAGREFAALAPETQKLAKGFIDGSITAGDWRKSVKGLSPEQAALARQFAVTENNARGFQQALRSGVSGSQTYSDAIKKMTGGANGLNTTLQLTGASMVGTNERIKAIAKSASAAGTDVQGWGSTQKLFSVQMDMFKQTLAKMAIEIGTVLIPALTAVVGWASKLFGWIDSLGSGWKKAIGIAALFAAALGPILWIGGKVVFLFGQLAKGAAFLATPFTRLGATIAETGATMGGLAARASESESVMTRAVVAGSDEQMAALERLMATQRLVAENAAVTSGVVARSGAALGVGAASMGGAAGVGRAGGLRFAGRMGGGSLLAGMGLGIGGQMLGGVISGNSKPGSGRNVAGTALADAGTGAMIGSMFGPEGMVAGAALGAGFGALKSYLGGLHQLSAGMKDYNTIDQHAGELTQAFANDLLAGGSALNAHRQATAAAMLSITDMGKRAAAAGLTQKDLTNAITGSDASYQKLVATWKASGTPSADTLSALLKMRQQFLDGTVAAQKFADAHGVVIAAEVRNVRQTDLLSGRLGNFNTMNLSAAVAQGVYRRQLDHVTASIAANGRTLDANTSFGQHNIATIRTAAAEALAHAQAVYKQTGSLGKADIALRTDRAELLATATRAGLTRGQVQNLADAISSIPANKHSRIVVDTAAALRSLSGFSAFFDSTIAQMSGRHIAGPVIGPATAASMAAGRGGLVGANAKGGPLADGWFTVGEQGFELGYKLGSKVNIFPHALSAKVLGSQRVPGFAAGTVNPPTPMLNRVVSGSHLPARTAPLINVEHVDTTVDLELVARTAEFRERAGHFN